MSGWTPTPAPTPALLSKGDSANLLTTSGALSLNHLVRGDQSVLDKINEMTKG